MPIWLEVIGGGRMGTALVRGLVASGVVEPSAIRVVEASAERRQQLASEFPGVGVTADPGPAEGAVVAVKPHDAEAVCTAVAAAGVPRVLSIAAGVTVARLEAACAAGSPDPVAVIRAMPNTPAQVGAGVAALAAGAAATADDVAWAEVVLASVGTTVRVDEELLDAVTGLSGSGPAYVFLVVEALIAAGVAEGLDPGVAGELVIATVAGAAALLDASGAAGNDAADLREAVTSPGGTTAAGLAVLDASGVRDAIVNAVAAAAARSRELGDA